jgi:xylose isomerase
MIVGLVPVDMVNVMATRDGSNVRLILETMNQLSLAAYVHGAIAVGSDRRITHCAPQVLAYSTTTRFVIPDFPIISERLAPS